MGPSGSRSTIALNATQLIRRDPRWGTRCFSVVNRPRMDVAFKANANVVADQTDRATGRRETTVSARAALPPGPIECRDGREPAAQEVWSLGGASRRASGVVTEARCQCCRSVPVGDAADRRECGGRPDGRTARSRPQERSGLRGNVRQARTDRRLISQTAGPDRKPHCAHLGVLGAGRYQWDSPGSRGHRDSVDSAHLSVRHAPISTVGSATPSTGHEHA